jgi:hypothetical protein
VPTGAQIEPQHCSPFSQYPLSPQQMALLGKQPPQPQVWSLGQNFPSEVSQHTAPSVMQPLPQTSLPWEKHLHDWASFPQCPSPQAIGYSLAQHVLSD